MCWPRWPDEKAAEVKKLQAAGRRVAMVRRHQRRAALAQPIWDWPWDRARDAMEAGDITLMRTIRTRGGSDRAGATDDAIIRQNSSGLRLQYAGIPIAALGLLSPMWASAAMHYRADGGDE